MTTVKKILCGAQSNGLVSFGTKTDGMFVVSPDLARNLARDLLIAADEAEGERPSHVYKVQAFTTG